MANLSEITIACPDNLEGACWGWLPTHTYDLGGVVLVSRIIWNITFSTKYGGVNYTYEVRVSTDNVTWTTIYSFINNSPASIVLDLAINNSARYLKLIKTNSDYMGFIDGSSVTVTYTGTEPPPPTCVEGTLRAPYWCADTTEIMREVCHNNEWVDSGQVCPYVCDLGETRCRTDQILEECRVMNQWEDHWYYTGMPCTADCTQPLYQDCPDGSQVMIKDCIDGNYVPTGDACPIPPIPIPEPDMLLIVGGVAIAAVVGAALLLGKK